MLFIATACGSEKSILNLAKPKKDNKQTVRMFSPMEKTDPNAENVARSAADKTIRMAEEKLGVTVDYMLSDSVTDNDANIIEQFRQITDCQPLERKQMAINVLRTIFSYFDKEEA